MQVNEVIPLVNDIVGDADYTIQIPKNREDVILCLEFDNGNTFCFYHTRHKRKEAKQFRRLQKFVNRGFMFDPENQQG